MSAEVVMLVGFPASGKSTQCQHYVDEGYKRLNRDTEGGKLSSLVPKMEAALTLGLNVVLDNTCMTVEARRPFIKAATKLGCKIRCVHIATSYEDSQVNACKRMIKKYGKLLGPDEIKKTKSPNTFPIVALFAARKKWEDPSVEEGFETVMSVPFVRENDPTYTAKALILDYDGTLRKTGSGDFFPRSANDVLILPGRTRKLAEYADKGYLLLGVSNQSGVHKGDLTLEDAKKCFDRTNELLGHQIDYRFCPHRAAPPRCYCRKPQVGLGIALIEEYKLNPSECIYVGDMTSDKTFAKRCGFKYEDAETFFEGK